MDKRVIGIRNERIYTTHNSVLMPVPLPGAPVTVVGVGLCGKAAGFTNEDPDFPFDHLDAIQRGVVSSPV